MNKTFFKYQSLGNDFILFDWYAAESSHVEQRLRDPLWSSCVIAWCNRHTGVGADGVLVLYAEHGMPVMRIFNADGSEAENCMNGLRCIALHLATEHEISSLFQIRVGSNTVHCEVVSGVVQTGVSFVRYEGAHTLSFSGGELFGHNAYAGNPHFIVFAPVDLAWLQQYGKELESHADFPKKSNISFVWPSADGYNIMTFERGCGITQACSSAALAVLKTMSDLGTIPHEKMISLYSLGGVIKGMVTSLERVILQAEAHIVFKGTLTASW